MNACWLEGFPNEEEEEEKEEEKKEEGMGRWQVGYGQVGHQQTEENRDYGINLPQAVVY